MAKLSEQYQQCRSEDTTLIDRARICAALTKPWILPPESHPIGDKLPEPFSSLGARGINNLEGRLLLALFPPGLPFFRLRPAAKFRNDPTIPPELLQEFDRRLFLAELVIQSKLEANQYARRSHTRRAGFRSRMRAAITEVLVTGDSLVEITDQYTLVVHRRDSYVTRRDTAGNVLHHITVQKIDPLSLDDDDLAAAGMSPEEQAAKQSHERLVDLYTGVHWEPRKRVWSLRQEINGKTIREWEEQVTPFMAIPYELPPGEHYGRGLIETNLGDLRSMNELTERILDFAGLASKHLTAIDYSSQVLPRDLASPTGSIIQARVQGGVVQDIGLLSANKLGDFQVVQATREAIRRDLSTVMLMEAESTPRGERVTAYQVERVAMELEGALGGVYAPLADACQIPLIERLIYMLRRDLQFDRLPDSDEAIEVEAITGIAALSREGDHSRLLGLLGTIGQLGPEAASRLNMGALLDLLMRQVGIYEPGLVKSEEQIAAEAAAMQEAQMGMRLVDEGAKAIGSIAANSAKGTPTT